MDCYSLLCEKLGDPPTCPACGGHDFRVYQERCWGEYKEEWTAFVELEGVLYAECLSCNEEEFLDDSEEMNMFEQGVIEELRRYGPEHRISVN